MIEQLLSFNGTDLTDFVTVWSVTRPVFASVDMDETEVPGVPGCLVSSPRLDSYKVKAVCMLKAGGAAEVEDKRRLLAAALAPGTEGDLVLPDSGGLRLRAVCTGGAELSRPSQYPTCKVEFLVTGPIARGDRKTVPVESSLSSAVRVGGTAPALPVVRCSPSSSPWRVTNVTTGEYVEVAGTFDGKRELVLDMGLERATVGGADVPVTVGSDFFELRPGTVQLKITSGSATVEWEERWY